MFLKFKVPGYSSSGQESHSSRSLRELVTSCPQLEKKRTMNKWTLSIQLAFSTPIQSRIPCLGNGAIHRGRSKIIPHRYAQRSPIQVSPDFVKLIICTSLYRASDLLIFPFSLLLNGHICNCYTVALFFVTGSEMGRIVAPGMTKISPKSNLMILIIRLRFLNQWNLDEILDWLDTIVCWYCISLILQSGEIVGWGECIFQMKWMQFSWHNSFWPSEYYVGLQFYRTVKL